MSLPQFIDIDGTLTDNAHKGGKPLVRRIDKIRLMIREGRQIVIWSANGTDYAREFCRRHSLTPLAVVGKPYRCVDDNPEIRPGGLTVEAPDSLDG